MPPIITCSNLLFVLLWFLQRLAYFKSNFVVFLLFKSLFRGLDLASRGQTPGTIFLTPWSGSRSARPDHCQSLREKDSVLFNRFLRIKNREQALFFYSSKSEKEASLLSLRSFRGGAAGYCLRVRNITGP